MDIETQTFEDLYSGNLFAKILTHLVPNSNSVLNDDKALNKMDAIVNLLWIVYEPFEDYDLILKD